MLSKAQTRLAATSPGAKPNMSRKLGGEISLVSATGSGTSIAVRIPIDHAS
ncbi:hypothetical protein B0G74_7426 [Paraburkholderia sp. BL9I2N2]|nr:hypothetical protein B0G74_7426 [Paraburkholderia sp. BL9I2N2]